MRRLAVYAAPRPATAWHDLAASWMGRSPEPAAVPARPARVDEQLAELTSAAARYGFHATLRNPFVPAADVDLEAVDETLRALAASLPSLRPTLRIDLLAGFPAFLPASDRGQGDLAAACVRGCAGIAAPPSADELARRRQAGLSRRQEELLVRWGYPYVMDEFRFHMTLGRRLRPGEADAVLAAARSHFGEVDGTAFPLDDLVLFEQVDDGPFEVRSRYPLGPITR